MVVYLLTTAVLEIYQNTTQTDTFQPEAHISLVKHHAITLFPDSFASWAPFKLTSDEPAEEEERCQRVPDRADLTERVGGAIFGLLSAGQAGEQRQHQAKRSHYYQVDGDVALPRTVMQIHRPCWTHGRQQEIRQSTFSFLSQVITRWNQCLNAWTCINSLTNCNLSNRHYAKKQLWTSWKKKKKKTISLKTETLLWTSSKAQDHQISPSIGPGGWGGLRMCRMRPVFDILTVMRAQTCRGR